MKKTITILLFVVSVSIFAQDQSPQEENRKNINTLLQLTGFQERLKVKLANAIRIFKSSFPKVPNSTWERLSDSLTPENINKLVVPAYEKHLSPETVKSLIEFYQSKAGKQMTVALPKIEEDIEISTQHWLEKIIRKK